MRVIIKHGSHKTYELDVSPRDSVASLKARVEGWGGPPFYQQRLVWGGTELEDQDAKLGSYGLREDGGGKVHVIGLSLMFPPAPDWEPFPLEIRTSIFSFMVEALPRDTMARIKEKIEREQGWRAAEQEVLLFDDDDRTVASNGLGGSSAVVYLYAKENTALFDELGGLEALLGSDGAVSEVEGSLLGWAVAPGEEGVEDERLVVGKGAERGPEMSWLVVESSSDEDEGGGGDGGEEEEKGRGWREEGGWEKIGGEGKK